MNFQMDWRGFLLICSVFVLGACSNQNADKTSKSTVTSPQFELLRKDVTGLDFENVLTQDSEFNVFNYMYYYNGGGVAAGDFNQDNLIDLFFTSNMGPNKLFLNKGDFQFEDVTTKANLEGMGGWTSGATVVDINQDGLLDIYVSQIGEYQNIKGRTQLYINQGVEGGVPVFQDEAISYGLANEFFATHATFFDYDLDGDLDMYQLNHSLHANGTFGQRRKFDEIHPASGDKLFRNDDGQFKDVTAETGIYSTVIGYGLGVVTGDINLDGWPDLYIGNDFHENDYLYINQQDGTFKEVLTEQMMHTSRFSMGVDMADINNDGYNEIISLDMLPDDPIILKSSLGEDAFNIFKFKLGYGYNHQYARNNLQLNNGDNTFSEIGMFAGVHATDWSWSPLFVDFDNDGYKDLFISNGIPRRMNDIDYVNYRADNEIRYKQQSMNIEEDDLVVIEKMPKIKLPNRFYHNSKDLTFEDWGEWVKGNTTTFSNGAIYADLDNDGDLDLVVNNIEDEPFVYKNLTSNKGTFLQLDLKGSPNNQTAIGTKVLIYKGKEQISYEKYLVRGYQSSMEGPLHLGIGDTTNLDSILLIWPDQSYQVLANPSFNERVSIQWEAGLPTFDFQRLQDTEQLGFDFADRSSELGLDVRHKENPFVEFNRESLIPHMVSAEGPALAIGDANGDGREDVFIGGSKREKCRLLLQQADGTFSEHTPESMQQDSVFEDVDAVFIDIENDGDLDLVVASGGNEFRGQQEPMRQRLYVNEGNGNFRSEKEVFENAFLTASCVKATDFNKDGKLDLFFGGRAVPWRYGQVPTSYLFENKGNGAFEEVTEQVAEGLSEVGFVKDASWTDIDLDGDDDLILALEWDAIHLFINEGGTLKERKLDDRKGWWNFALAHDFDQDGDVDILAGNLGRNSKFKPTKKQPIRMYVNDYDDNKQVEQILTYYLGNREIPFANYAELTKTLPHLKKQYLYSKDLATASLDAIFGKEKIETALQYEVNELQSIYYENTGKGLEFKAHYLPNELQFSTLNAAYAVDVNKDGKKEVLLGGNFYECNIEMGRYDANYGNVLSINQNAEMQVMPLGNMNIKGKVQTIQPILINGEKYFFFGKNDDQQQVLQLLD